MIRLFSLAVILVTLSVHVSAAIGPEGLLPIVNRDIAPDGYRRS